MIGPGHYEIPSMFGDAFAGSDSHSRPGSRASNSRPSTTSTSERFRGKPRPTHGSSKHGLEKDLKSVHGPGDIVVQAIAQLSLEDENNQQ